MSMGSIILHATTISDGSLLMEALFDLIRSKRDIDALAWDAGSIGCELLTSLDSRYHRQCIHY
jgi:alanine racemase